MAGEVQGMPHPMGQKLLGPDASSPGPAELGAKAIVIEAMGHGSLAKPLRSLGPRIDGTSK
jgi:hypothetical protein